MQKTPGNQRLRERILSVRLSPEGMAFWTDDAVATGEFDTESMSVVRTSDEDEIHLSFDDPSDAEENVAGFIVRLKEICSALLQPAPTKAVVCIDTLKTVMIPSEIYRDGAVGEYLSIHNISVDRNEQADISKPVCGTVAVMVSDRAVLEHLGKALGEFKVVSPLQYNLMLRPVPVEKKGEAYVLLYNCPQRIYISVFATSDEKELIYNDVFPVTGDPDIIYCLDRIRKEFPVSGSTLFVSGFGKEKLSGSIGQYFKNVRCV